MGSTKFIKWVNTNLVRMEYVHQEHGIKFDLEIQVPKHQSFCRLVDIRKVTLSKNPPSKLPQLTHTQINNLAVVHGLTKTQVIIVAVDRLARDLNAESLEANKDVRMLKTVARIIPQFDLGQED